MSLNFRFEPHILQSTASTPDDLPQEPGVANSAVTTTAPASAAISAAVAIADELQATKEALLQSQNEVKSLQEKQGAAARAFEAKIAALQSEVGSRANDASATQNLEARIADLERAHAQAKADMKSLEAEVRNLASGHCCCAYLVEMAPVPAVLSCSL